MKGRRVRRVIVFVLIGVVMVVGGGLIALQLTSPTAPILDSPLSGDPLTQEQSEADMEPRLPDDNGHSPETADSAQAFQSTGQLAIFANEQRIGSESYAIRVEGDQVDLDSVGLFEFRAVIATVRAAFEQSLRSVAGAPTSYTYELDAPLGRSARIEATAEGGIFQVERDDDTVRLAIPAEGAVVLGTFSSYAGLPPLLRDLEIGSRWSSPAFVFGGRPGGQEAEGEILRALRIVRGQDVQVRLNELPVTAETYHVDSPSGAATLYARGEEFLAFVAEGEGSSLTVYREDAFPDGFDAAP